VLGALGRGPLDDVALKARAAQMKTPLSRCAVAIARTPHGGEVVVGIAADALGELAAIPTHARTGEWLAFDARLALPARGATLVILGPHGAPRTVPTSYDARTGRTKARFALDRPGAFKVQLVADVDEDRESGETHGPRPLLEAKVYADVPLPATLDAEPAPGEDAANGATGADAIARMVDAARASEGLGKLVRDPRLEELAKRHVERMRDRGAIAHDVGDGDARERFEAEDGAATRIGENVAKASTEAAAHRALWDSPSHRMNLIRADYTHVGIATATAPDGTVFVCEVFASRPKR
jgi:uncharacterized protein YkwD